MAAPKYLTGDKAGIDEFIDRFDVCNVFEVDTEASEY